MKKIAFVVALLLCLQNRLAAQFTESRLVLVSENKVGNEIKYYTDNAFMTLNLSSGDFSLNTDLSTLITGDRKTDSLLQAQGEQPLVFKGNISESLFLFNQQENDEGSHSMSGSVFLNGMTIPGVAQFDPVNLADKSEVKNYRMDLSLPVDLNKLSIKGLEGKLNRQLVLEVMGGKLNVSN